MKPKKQSKALNINLDAYLYFRLENLAEILRSNKTAVLETILASYFNGLDSEDITGYKETLVKAEKEFFIESGYDQRQLRSFSQLRSRIFRVD